MILVFTLSFLLIGLGTSTEGWLTVKREVDIAWDLEETPLEIKTNSELGSGELVLVIFFPAAGDRAGGVGLKFSTTLQYWIDRCTTSWTDLPTTPPSSVNKVWRITLNRDPEIRVKITCNGKEVLNLLISDTTCSFSIAGKTWRDHWNRDVEKILFTSGDTASDGYRPGAALKCTGLTASWENMDAETSFPVTAGTEVSLTCKDGYELKGDNTVICVKDTEFKYSEEPECVTQCVGLNPSWTNMKTDTTFPVAAGTLVKVSCNEGHGLTGSETVTCTKGTEFEFTTEPQCVAQCSGLTSTWTHMKANTVFPVTAGTKMSLSCESGYGLAGDTSVTCIKNTEFNYDVEPECVKCTAGTYRDSTITSCTKCPENKITEQDGATSCSSCPAGKMTNAERTKCVSCSADTYKSSSMNTCQSCGQGKEPNSDKTSCVFQCSGLTPAWTQMKADKVFPVTAGTKVSLSCESGYGLKGDTSVTCIKNTEFNYNVEPECVSCTGLKNEWKNTMKTTTQFPVAPGTVVKVTCSESQSLLKTGSNELTCTSGTNFGYVTEPKCLPIGNSKGTKT